MAGTGSQRGLRRRALERPDVAIKTGAIRDPEDEIPFERGLPARSSLKADMRAGRDPALVGGTTRGPEPRERVGVPFAGLRSK